MWMLVNHNICKRSTVLKNLTDSFASYLASYLLQMEKRQTRTSGKDITIMSRKEYTET